MAASGFSERLRREIARNKVKSAALAILCLVACYFWLPFVTKFFKKKQSPTPVVQPAETTPVVNTAPTAPIADDPQFDWKEFLAWMASEPRMTVMSVSTETRDPFSSWKAQARPVSSQDTEAHAPASSVAEDDATTHRVEEDSVKSPKDCGLQLRSTFVGGRKSSANINGTNYEMGDSIPITSANEDPTDTDATDGFQLVEVRPRFVTLQSKGQLFRLELHERTSVDQKISIRPAKP